MLLPPPLATFLPRATHGYPRRSASRRRLGSRRSRSRTRSAGAISWCFAFVVINLVATALFCAAWLKGWVAMILAGDSTHQVVLIAAVFAYGLVRCGGKIFITSAELNQTRELPLRTPIAGAEISREHQGARRPVAGDQRLGAQDEAHVPDRIDPAHRQQPRVPGPARHRDRLHHGALGRGCARPPVTSRPSGRWSRR